MLLRSIHPTACPSAQPVRSPGIIGDELALTNSMKEKTLSVPDIGFIAVTRVVLGVGIGLLISGGLDREQRRVVGSALLGIGAVTTIPILMRVFGGQCQDRGSIQLVA